MLLLACFLALRCAYCSTDNRTVLAKFFTRHPACAPRRYATHRCGKRYDRAPPPLAACLLHYEHKYKLRKCDNFLLSEPYALKNLLQAP